jgi:hypothetical protein
MPAFAGRTIIQKLKLLDFVGLQVWTAAEVAPQAQPSS